MAGDQDFDYADETGARPTPTRSGTTVLTPRIKRFRVTSLAGLLMAGAAVSACQTGRGSEHETGPRTVLQTRLKSGQFRFERAVSVAAGSASSACAVLDAATYEHAGPSLDDVRLFSGSAEIAYALTMSNTSYLSPASEQVKVLNLGLRKGHVVFDLAMPARAYSRVDLDLRGANFLATARVTGSAEVGQAGTDVGTFTLFDLTGQKLGRNTSLNLRESTFAFLHVDLEVSSADADGAGSAFRVSGAMVAGATVPPSREAQTIYTEVARTSSIVAVGRMTEATFTLPARVPVERVVFVLSDGKSINFSRKVTVTAHPVGAPADEREEVAGDITSIRLTERGHELRRQSLGIAATLGANARKAATVVVSIDNGDEPPLGIAAVVLAMRQRKLCFDVPAGPVAMFYGDAGLGAPRYGFSRAFQTSDQTRAATLGPEEVNPGFTAPAATGSSAERHRGLIEIALLAVVAALGFGALRLRRRMGGKP